MRTRGNFGGANSGQTRATAARNTLVLLAVATGTFLLGRLTVPSAPAHTVTAAPSGPADHAAGSGERSVAKPVPLAAPKLAEGQAPAAAPCEAPVRRETATAMIDTLFRRLPSYGGGASPLYSLPERSARSVLPYLVGMVDGALAAAPSVRAGLAEEFTERLCNQTLKDDQLMLMASLGREAPDIVSTKGLDCVFARRGSKEDVVLWSMLDTWRRSGQEKTAAINEIERRATDERTKQRFLSNEEEMRQREATDDSPPRGGPTVEEVPN
jgi:hypothetical protein